MFSSTELLYNDNRTLHAQRFKILNTLKPAYAQLFVNILVELVVVCITCVEIPIILEKNDISSSLYSIQAAFWLFSLIFHYIYSSDHWYLKLGGHFTFYRKIKKHVYALFLIPSLFNIVVIILQAIFNKSGCINTTNLPLFHYVVGGVISFEIFITLPIIVGYIITVHKFNQIKPIPDTEQYEYLLPCDARSASEIGYRLDGDAIADILEKQADIIYYLKCAVAELNIKLASRS